jgi:phage-related minor tail protein
MNIGDLFLQLLADGSKLTPSVQKEAAKAGDEGAKTLGQRLAGGLKTNGLKVFGAAASAAFAVATAGALKLTEVQARFRSETGASADEAKAAAKTINAIAGRERAALEDVADAAISVRRNLGATGKDADDLTARFVRFARVTKQDAAGAVADFDDILDAWNIPAAQSGEIMDKLIVSGQKYGGVIADDQKALAAMAPQLKALNLNLDDGIALLDLFKSSGLDAASIPKALNSAIQKLDGRPLEDFIAELAGIEDPGKRAQRAIEIFGSKAGVGLANAIKPGMTSLDDFAISADEAKGSVDKAADALDSTPWAKFQIFLSEASAGLRGLGDDFGPLLTGLASLGTLLGSQLSKQLLEAGKAAGGALIDGIGTATGAAGTIIGNLVANILDPTNPLLGNPVRRAALATGALFSRTFALATKLADGVAAAVNAIPGVGAVKAGAAKLGTFLGTTAGKAFSLAFLAAVVLLVVDTYNRIKTEIAQQTQGIAESVGNGLKTATDAQLEIQRQALKTGMDELAKQAYAGNFLALDPLKDIVAQYNRVQTELNDRAALAARVQEAQLRAAKDGTMRAAEDLVDVLPTALEKGQALARAAAEEWLRKPIGERLVLIGHDARQAGAQAALQLADGLRSARANIGSALEQLKEDMKNKLTPKAEVGLRIGQLFSKTLARGLKDSDPVIKAQAKATRALIEDQLIETIKAGGVAGQKIQEELEKKLHSKDPAIKAQAQRTKSVIDEALKAEPGKNPGDVIGDQLAKDLAAANTQLGKAAYSLGRTIARNLIRGVQGTGVSVPSTNTRYAGKALPEYASGTGYVPFDQLAVIHRGEIVVPEAPAAAIRAGDAVLSGVAGSPRGGDTYHNTWVMPEPTRDPWEVLERTSRYARWGRLKSGPSDV